MYGAECIQIREPASSGMGRCRLLFHAGWRMIAIGRHTSKVLIGSILILALNLFPLTVALGVDLKAGDILVADAFRAVFRVERTGTQSVITQNGSIVFPGPYGAHLNSPLCPA